MVLVCFNIGASLEGKGSVTSCLNWLICECVCVCVYVYVEQKQKVLPAPM